MGPPAGAGATQRKLPQVPPLGRVPHTQAASTTAAMPGALASRLLPRLVSPLAKAHPSTVPPPHSNLLQEKYLDRACLPCHELHTEGAKRRKVGSIGPQTTSEQFMPVVGIKGTWAACMARLGRWPTEHMAEGAGCFQGLELWRGCRIHAYSPSVSLTSTRCEFLGYSEASPSPGSFPVKSLHHLLQRRCV